MPTIVHFEIPADDVERVIKFYSGMFGWEIKQLPGMDYWMVSTTGTMAIGGGIMKRRQPGQMVTNYIDVPSVEDYSAKVKKLGGKVLVTKTAVPGMGYFAVCMDTENNLFGLWQDDTGAK